MDTISKLSSNEHITFDGTKGRETDRNFAFCTQRKCVTLITEDTLVFPSYLSHTNRFVSIACT